MLCIAVFHGTSVLQFHIWYLWYIFGCDTLWRPRPPRVGSDVRSCRSYKPKVGHRMLLCRQGGPCRWPSLRVRGIDVFSIYTYHPPVGMLPRHRPPGTPGLPRGPFAPSCSPGARWRYAAATAPRAAHPIFRSPGPFSPELLAWSQAETQSPLQVGLAWKKNSILFYHSEASFVSN